MNAIRQTESCACGETITVFNCHSLHQIFAKFIFFPEKIFCGENLSQVCKQIFALKAYIENSQQSNDVEFNYPSWRPILAAIRPIFSEIYSKNAKKSQICHFRPLEQLAPSAAELLFEQRSNALRVIALSMGHSPQCSTSQLLCEQQPMAAHRSTSHLNTSVKESNPLSERLLFQTIVT